ncbi:hypothetical protein HC931_24295 [Candidatus Gracilibacteria bacterium]|jgi:hypothetical protein|nr:hypothetical protein [Candidatus Gracilibacteria bacterium]NJM89705.1 hypothetical protein [Hydrococcus sp. RU_2_2]NJP21561.1 hypothetical protein [Hydrococcus sp. CRU_1_1]
MQNFLSFSVRFAAIFSLPTILLILSIPIRPASAGNEFSACIGGLVDSGVSPEQAGEACSDALVPEELAECVGTIRGETSIEAEDALSACYRVRRPNDMAECVVDIHADALNASPAAQSDSTKDETKSSQAPSSSPPTEVDTDSPRPTELEINQDEEMSPSLMALDSCRRSLFPERHASCVLALSQDIPANSPAKAMETCLSAEDFPRELFPAYSND